MRIPTWRQSLDLKTKRWQPGGKSAMFSGSPASSSETLVQESGGGQNLCRPNSTEPVEIVESPRSVPHKCCIVSPEKLHAALVTAPTTDHQTACQKTTPNPDLVAELHVSTQQPRRWKGTLQSDKNAVRRHCFQTQASALALSNLPNPQSSFFLESPYSQGHKFFITFVAKYPSPS